MSDPSYLLSLSVENIRCFGPEQTLSLQREDGSPAMWTVLLGENGVGKTTLLQLIAGSMPHETPINQLTTDANNDEPNFIPWFVKSRMGTWLDEQIRTPGKATTTLTTRHESLKVQAFKQGGVTSSLSTVSPSLLIGYGATRKPSVSSLSHELPEDRTKTLFDDDATLINAEEWYLRQHLAAREPGDHQPEAQRRLDQVRELLTSKLLPDIEDLRIAGLGGVRAQPYVEVKTVYGWSPMRELSLGYKAVIAWVVDLAARMIERYPDINNPLSEPAIVLVDEIDLHLHPTWQRQVVGYLRERFPKVQFIVTAHSPLVVQAAQDANVVLLRREGDHVVIDNDFDHVSRWRADQILTSDLFGLPSTAPPVHDALFEEREELLSKPTLTDEEKQRIEAIDAILDETPSGRTPEESEAMRLIMQAAAQLRAGGDP
jgi:energy-coupling factor transporter ATP-binding protein EcfA2